MISETMEMSTPTPKAQYVTEIQAFGGGVRKGRNIRIRGEQGE